MKIFCFSGTGNSYSVAKEIGKSFSVEPVLIAKFKDQSSVKITDSQIGIITPVYLNDIPRIVKEFILRLSFERPSTYVFAVLTSGSGRNKNGFKNINIALAQHNVKLSLAFDVQMPSSFQARNDMDSVLDAVPERISRITAAIKNRLENYTPQGSAILPKDLKNAVAFGTYGNQSDIGEQIISLLRKQHINVVGEPFVCKGDSPGTDNKGRPSAADLQNAKEFANGIVSKLTRD